MTCPSCGTENPPGKRFCTECGTALALACPSCGGALTGNEKYCGECGAPLASQPREAITQPAAPAAERRLVSVLFADLVGFTAASESRDAEETRELLSRYFDTCRRLIELYGGTVEKFIGDAVMAVWGTPTATEDDAERAVRVALDLVAAVSALGDEVGAPELRARAGVLTGEAAVTIGAEGQGMVAGDLVNTAARIQSLAEPGTVLVGEATRRATDETIAYVDAGSHELKGKAGLIPVWQALRVVSGARGSLKSTGLEAPFVGRDLELRRIKDLFHVCADEGKPQLISITGIAGVGKSRLAWEFYKYFDGLPQITYWHRGRCLSYGEGVTYWALADMVRMRARIAEEEDPSSALPKLAEVVEAHMRDDEERRFVEPRLRHLLGLEEGRFERDDLFAAWRLFLERLADVYPTVMVFEDTQWADVSLLDFIEYLLERSRASPLFVVTLARPELHDRRPGWGAASRNFTSLYLEPLEANPMQTLLAGLVPGLPQELHDQILERAEGIPLYAVETVRMLLDRGALVQEESVYRPTATIEALEVPETLHALIAARLDGLSPNERRVVQDGAVLGKTFTKHALGALSGFSEVDLDRILLSLTRKEVFGLQADPRSPEHGQYGFLQDLLRRVAYETVARSDRKKKHLAAAAYLEQALGEQEVVEVVAAHYLDAYRLASGAPDAAEIKAAAVERLTGAGDRAASLGANEEAQRYFEQAASLADDPLHEARLRERAGAAAYWANQLELAQTQLSRALELWDAASQTHSAARVSARLGEAEWQAGNLERALERMEPAFAVLAAEEPDADVAELAAQLARLHFFHGALDDAAARAETALTLAESLWLPKVLAEALMTKGLIADSRSRTEEALALLHHGVKLAIEHDLPETAGRGYLNLAALLTECDRHEEAIVQARRGVEVLRRGIPKVFEGHLLSNLSEALAHAGRWDEALEVENEMSISTRDANPFMQRPWIAIQRGHPDQARQLMQHPVLQQPRDVQDRAYGGALTAALLRAEGNPADALAHAEEGLAAALSIKANLTRASVEVLESALSLGNLERVEQLLESMEVRRPGELRPSLRAQAARFRAKLAAARGDVTSVEPGFKTATSIFREFGLVFWLGVSLLEHGEWLVEQGATADAEPLLAEAREIFEGLEATPWLERADTVGSARREQVHA
jgi:class 3 adenylate cyclase/tetratricopeptide (TPR) repeat protein